MEHNFWHNKWQSNQLGFHQKGGHSELTRYFPKLDTGASVLVPLCGKSEDMLWLAKQGYQVVGVELSDIAAKDFFTEHGLSLDVDEISSEGLQPYRCLELPITIYVGDFFNFSHKSFDALYDRAALIALPQPMRAAYLKHCQSLLAEDASALVITTVYDDAIASGPPFSVSDQELTSLWHGGTRLATIELIDQEPRWQAKGLTSFKEHIWRF